MAIVNAEPGHENLTEELLAGAVASTVNLAEVQTKLVNRGWPSEVAWQDAHSPIKEAMAFEAEHARLAGDLAAPTKHLPLFFGYCPRLAPAIFLDAPRYPPATSLNYVE